MKQSEKNLVGLMLLAGGVALVALVGMPQWKDYNDKNAQVTQLNAEIKSFEVQKQTLTTNISLLEQHTAIPPGIEIQRYNNKNREALIKGMLDNVVNLATGAGNKFISLAPADANPILPAKPAASSKDADTTNTPGDAAGAAGTTQAPAGASTDPNAPPPPPSPVLTTFCYEMSFRGTYDTIQKFLRAMASQKALLEISGITLENEVDPEHPDAGSVGANPSYPIKMTARIRLAMQPENP